MSGISRKSRRRLIALFDHSRSVLLDFIDRVSGSGPGIDQNVSRNGVNGVATGIAIVGCGFVADFYGETLRLHPDLELVAVHDRDQSRADRFSTLYGGRVYADLDTLLRNPSVEIVVNLTNPVHHFAISQAALLANKHVYSEKPLAMNLQDAKDLVQLAADRDLVLSGAPCVYLGEALQALEAAVRQKLIGRIRLVYAEIDDGPIHRMHPHTWKSPNATPWPWEDEYRVGCTVEHAGYHLTWLIKIFGPAVSVTAFSSCVVPNKHPDLSEEECGRDFSVACVRFGSGVVARITCSIVAPHDHSLRIIGDEGVLSVDEIWHFGAPVRLRRFSDLNLRAESYGWISQNPVSQRLFGLAAGKLTLSPTANWRRRIRRHEMDYALGISELAAAIHENRPPKLSARLALHVTELALAIDQSRDSGVSVHLTTSC
jgi:predicted dehydrogenase